MLICIWIPGKECDWHGKHNSREGRSWLHWSQQKCLPLSKITWTLSKTASSPSTDNVNPGCSSWHKGKKMEARPPYSSWGVTKNSVWNSRELKPHKATKRQANDNNLFIQVEDESLAVKNTKTEGELMRTFGSEVLHEGKRLVRLGH